MNFNPLETNTIPADLPQKQFKHLLELITSLIPLAYIFQHRADTRGITLIMVLDRFQYQATDVIKNMLEFIALGKINIEIRYFSYGTMHDMLTRGNIFYSSYCRREHCIYQSAPQYELIETPACKLSEIRAHSALVIHHGLEKAKSFQEGALVYFNQGKFHLSAFMLHQTCEQIFSLIIKLFEGKATKSHQLILLQKDAGFYLPAIKHIFDIKKSKELKWLELLQQAYIGARYDDHYKITPEHLAYLQEKINAVLNRLIEVLSLQINLDD
ncbi:HEPN domain-containing protein [Agrobacterium tumefaciens]|nr:HEPN domain-containing protein [Agrobacterium tumefaciens]NTE21358.1 HEPN domain-containing protein [Agrobacterium tumefaciens]